MLNKLLELINKLFSKKEVNSENKTEDVLPTISSKIAIKDRIISELDFNQYGDVEIISTDAPNTMLIIDDIVESAVLYNIDFNRVKRQFKKDIKADYNLVLSIGDMAGFRAFKYILNGGKVDFAIIDLTLGYTLKLENGDYLEIDGVDIAALLLKINPNARLVISTVHTMNRHNPSIAHYFDDFKERTGKELADYYFNKNGNRATDLYKVLYNES